MLSRSWGFDLSIIPSGSWTLDFLRCSGCDSGGLCLLDPYCPMCWMSWWCWWQLLSQVGKSLVGRWDPGWSRCNRLTWLSSCLRWWLLLWRITGGRAVRSCLCLCPFQSCPLERLSGVRRAAGQAGHERSGVLGQRRGEDGTFSHLGTWIKDQQRSPYYLYFLRSQTFAW